MAQQDQSTRIMLTLTLGGLFIITAAFTALAAYAISRDDAGAAVVSSTLDINLEEFSITGDLVAPAGEVTLLVHNNGSMDHNLAVRELDLITPTFGSGGTVSLELGQLAPGASLVTVLDGAPTALSWLKPAAKA